MKWLEDLINKVICGDCLEVMKGMPDNYIDTIITDPPYGLEFMGKEWDKFPIRDRGKRLTGSGNPTEARGFGKNVAYGNSKESLIAYQEFSINWATEALRVAKPSATLLCFGGTRTYHRLACAIEDAGWILKDCIMWLYGSGFPKATDISQMLDKDECRKRLEKKLNRRPTQREFKKEWKKFRKITGKKECGYQVSISRIRKEQGYRPNLTNATREVDITAPTTPEATLWNGWKSHGLKPAYEPILVAMKPNEGSYANNALKYGVAGLNIDGGRIKTNPEVDDMLRTVDRKKRQTKTWENGSGFKNEKNSLTGVRPEGRYPANVILDEEAGRMLDEQSGNTSVTGKRKNPLKSYHQPEGGEWFGRKNHNGAEYQDKGGASRFFYCAKASKAERNRGCEELDSQKAVKNFMEGSDPEYINTDGSKRHRRDILNQNNHPTVKPLSLMKYLCTLTKTPTGGIVLDPFCGSGTTLMACKESKRDYIGVDNVPEYCEIARRRVNAVAVPLF